MENIELVYSLFNQYLYQEAKSNIDLLDYYFQTNPGTMGNQLITELLDSIKKYPLESLDIPLFQSILVKTGKNNFEQQKIINDIIRWKTYGKDQIEPARQFLRDVCSSCIIRRANNLYQNSPTEFLKYLKQVDLHQDMSDVMSTITLDNLDINTVVADGGTKGFASTYDWINESFRPLNAYPGGTITLISCPPGTGKTLFSLNEALTMALAGHKVHYLCMGDMKPYTVIWRLCTIYSGLPMHEAALKLSSIFKSLSAAIGKNFSLAISPAGRISIDEYIEYMKCRDDEVCFIDYDSNFKVDLTDSMYESFGNLYCRITELSAMGKLVFILAQPKICAWGTDIITIDNIGESSRKIHTVDTLITGGVFPESPNHLGKFSIQKSRQGDTTTVPYIRLNNGRFKFLPGPVYSQLCQIQEKRYFTEGEIDQMIKQYEAAMQQHNINMMSGGNVSPIPSQQKVSSKINNPFV